MKLSDKFKNLGRSGLARRVAKDANDDRREHAKPRSAAAPVAPKRAVVEKAVEQVPPMDGRTASMNRVKRWREANPELYRERQRAYQAKHKAKKLAEKVSKK